MSDSEDDARERFPKWTREAYWKGEANPSSVRMARAVISSSWSLR